MKFRSDEDGYITALRFYKQANNTGSHVGHLWSGTGQLLAAVPFTDETPRAGRRSSSPTRCRSPRTPPTSPPTTRPRGATGSARASSTRAWTARRCTRRTRRARRAATASSATARARFPDQSFNATNYWVDATFHRTIPPDTRGPTITDALARGRRVGRAQATTGHGDLRRAARAGLGHGRHLHPARRGRRRGGGRRQLRRADARREAQARSRRSSNSETYTARLKGGSGGVTDAAGQPAGRRPRLVVHAPSRSRPARARAARSR